MIEFRPKGLSRLVVGALAAFALLAGACGDDSSGGGSESTATTQDQSSGGGEPSGDPVKIGAVIPLSGPAALVGEDQLAGLEMARDELNASGGILGRPVELIVKDDGGEPTKAAQVTRELIDQDEVDMLFGPTLTSATLAGAPIASEADIVQFATGVTPELGDPAEYPTFFRIAPNANLQAQTFVDYVETRGWTDVGLLVVNNSLGASNVDAFTKAAEGTSIKIVGTEFFESGAVDLSTHTASLQRAGAEVVLALSSAPPDVIGAIKARNQLSWDVPILTFTTGSNPAITEAVGEEGMKDVFAGQAYGRLTTPAPEATAKFLEAMRERLGVDELKKDITQAAGAYDAIMMYANAVNAVGTLDTDEVVAHLEANPHEGVKSSLEYDSERHDGDGLDDLVFVVASSFKDGLLEVAPGS